jgi:hypothetical protein
MFHLSLIFARQRAAGEESAGRQMRSSEVSVRDQAQNLLIEHTQIPID